MLQFHCRTDSSVGKSVGTESRRSWVQIPLGPPSLTSKLSHRSSINIILLHSDKLFLKLYIYIYNYDLKKLNQQNLAVTKSFMYFYNSQTASDYIIIK